MFATTVQVELNATLHVCESGLQDIRIFLGLVPKESPCIGNLDGILRTGGMRWTTGIVVRFP
jgi:hypothetical protein